jgi:hypothetical protein
LASEGINKVYIQNCSYVKKMSLDLGCVWNSCSVDLATAG